MKPEPIFAKNLQTAMKISGINSRQLHLKTGITECALRRYRRGDMEPTLKITKKLCHGLNIDPNFLLGFETMIMDSVADRIKLQKIREII